MNPLSASTTQWFEFVISHWMLFVALVLILALLVHNILFASRGSVDPLQATQLINHEAAVVIDVRPAADFSQGHIINALNIPINGFKNQMGTLQKYKDQPILVNCRSGSQSSIACTQLRKEGFQRVHNLRGGILAWQAASLPLTKKRR
jgi:rhodanese-related sulfurtransferase